MEGSYRQQKEMRNGFHILLLLFSITLSYSFAASSPFVAGSQPSSHVDDHVHREVQSSSEFGNTEPEFTDDFIKGFMTMEPVVPTLPPGDENSTMITAKNNTNSTDSLLGNSTSPIINGTDINGTFPITNGTDIYNNSTNSTQNNTGTVPNGNTTIITNGTYPIINGTDIYNNSTNTTQNNTGTDTNGNTTIINNGTYPIINGTDIYNNSTNTTQNNTGTDTNGNTTIINNGTYPIINGTDIYNNSTNTTQNNNQTNSGGNMTVAPSIMPTSLLLNNNTNQTTNITSFPSLTPTYDRHSNHPSVTPTWRPPTNYPTIREPKYKPPHSVIRHPTHKPWHHRPVPTAAPNFDNKLKDEINEEKEQIEKVAKDPTAEILAAILITVAIVGMLTVAYQVLENPDGLCARYD